MATRDPDFPLVAHFTDYHVRVQASGTLGQSGGNETWTMGCKVMCTAPGAPSQPVVPTQSDVADIAAAGLAAFSGLIRSGISGGTTTAAGLISDDVALTEVKAYSVGPDNHANSNVNTVYDFPSAPVKGTCHPDGTHTTLGRETYSQAVVITFRGDQFRKGQGAFGRIYLPGANVHATNAPDPLPLVDGLMDPVTVAGFAAAGAAFVHTMNNAQISTNTIHTLVNLSVSKVLQSSVRFQPVTIVDVDNRPDTVRRRSNKIGGRGKITIAV